MSDAERDILKMVADKVITVEEAERLLSALHEGGKRQEESKSRGGHTHRMGHTFEWCGPRRMGKTFESFGAMLGDIGPMIKNAVDDVVTGLWSDDLGESDEEEFVDVEPIDGKYELLTGTHLVILDSWKDGHGKGDLEIQGVAGSFCKLDNQNSKNVRVQQGSSHCIIRWEEGPLRIEVPETVSTLKVRTKGGNISVKQIGCEMSLKTFGGNLEMFDLMKPFKAKTMGGHIKLVLANAWQGKARVHTMGGNIALAIPPEVALRVEATTMGGAIRVAENIRQLESKQFFPGKSTVKVQIGEKNTDAFIALKTVGGDIELRKVDHE